MSARCPSCGCRHAAVDTDLVNRLHAAEARAAVLESQAAAIPWADLARLADSINTPIWYYANLYPEGKDRIMNWLNTNAPKEGDMRSMQGIGNTRTWGVLRMEDTPDGCVIRIEVNGDVQALTERAEKAERDLVSANARAWAAEEQAKAHLAAIVVAWESGHYPNLQAAIDAARENAARAWAAEEQVKARAAR